MYLEKKNIIFIIYTNNCDTFDLVTIVIVTINATVGIKFFFGFSQRPCFTILIPRGIE